jgi:hypothetical protein
VEEASPKLLYCYKMLMIMLAIEKMMLMDLFGTELPHTSNLKKIALSVECNKNKAQ